MSAREWRERLPPAGADRLPLSPAQEGFWLLDALHPGDAGSNEQFGIFLDGPLDVGALGAAWRAVVTRHEILRARFGEDGGTAWQHITSEPASAPEFVDLATTHETLPALAARLIQAPFDLREGPPFRAVLLRLETGAHALLVTVHHIAADGMSVPIIRDDLARFYAAFCAGSPPPESAPAPRYLDFAVRERERERLTDAALAPALAWWRAQLSGAPGRHALPQLAVPEAGRGEARRLAFSIEAVTADRLRAIARANGVTLFTLLLAAFRALLVRYGGEDDVLISSPVTAREDPATRRMVGCLINNVVFRTPAGGDPRFTELLARERATLLGLLEHREVPFGRVVESLGLPRRPGEQPLSQILFQFDAAPPPRVAAGVNFRIEPVHADRHSWWDLEWALADRGPGRDLAGHVCYPVARFDGWLVEAMPRHFAVLLSGIADDPERRLSELPLLDDAERHRLLVEWNETSASYPDHATLHGLVAEQCARSPQAPALRTDAGSMSYGELERRVSAAAARLHALGVGPGDFVGLSLPPAANLVVGLLAILRSGAAVVPLDPGYPRSRLEFMLRDSGARILVSERGTVAGLGGGAVARLELDESSATDQPADLPPPAVTPDSPAYVLYTSGSTGEPKGAIGLHRGAVNRCHWMWREYGFGPDDVFCLRTSINFVDALWEIFGALIHGIPLVVLSADATRDPALLVPALARHGVTQLVLVPPLLGALLDTTPDLAARAPGLRTIVTSGEPLSPDLWSATRQRWPRVRLLNTYGTSEIWDATCCDTSLLADNLRRVPIGKPIANVRCYVLDRNLRPVPPGVPAELCVAGIGIGAGYWQRPELTAERFVADPFTIGSANRLYRSGDLARFLPDGSIECLGRMDRQLKLRGFRLEPGEIEAALRECPGVADAAVVLRGDGGESRLVAYVADGGAGVEVEALRIALRRLPEFMRPTAWMLLARLPLTPSGKVDRNALPAPPAAAPRRAAWRPPADALEARLLVLWSAVLGSAEVGPDDNFFDLGGQSLAGMRLLARVAATCGVTLTLREFFEAPTVAAVAARVRARGGGQPAPPPAMVRDAGLPLSLGQERLWFLDQLDPASPAYNLAWTIQIDGDLDVAHLQRALDRLVARHESLRTVFPTRAGRPVQVIRANLSITLSTEILGAAAIESRRQALARQPFDLAAGPLLRVALLRIDGGGCELLVVIHHAISDGTSNGILFGELCRGYGAVASADAAVPDPLPAQYADFASWQRRWLAGERSAGQLEYWARKLTGAPAALELPADFPRPAEQKFRGAWVWRSLPARQAAALRVLAGHSDCTLYMLMLAAFKVLVWRRSGQEDLLVGTPVSARPHPDLEGLIGLFINTVVLRTSAAGEPSFDEFLARVRLTVLEAFENQDVPFERVVERLAPERTLARAPVFQVMFNLVPIPERVIATGGVEFRLGQLLDHGVSTFDLTLTVGEHAEGLELIFEFDTDLFRGDSIGQMADAYLDLLDGILRDPSQSIAALAAPGPVETARIEGLLTGSSSRRPVTETALSILAQRVAAQPEAEAVRGPDGVLSYAALEARANRIAHLLLQRGCTRGQRVGVCLRRSAALPAAIIGVLKAGAAYVPLDPDAPAGRLRAVAADADIAAIITHGNFVDVGVPALDLAGDGDQLDSLPADAPPVPVRPTDIAYVIYTSGSTGEPKGAVVTHASLAATFRGWESVYQLTSADTHLQMANVAFDVFTGDWARALLSGARLVLCPREVLLDPARLHALLVRERVTVAEFVPAVMRALLAWLAQAGRDLSFMRLIAVGSESWYGQEYRALRARCGGRVVNSYGLAEATIDSTWFESDSADPGDGVLPIGRPFPQVVLRILDERLRPVPAGVPGELCIGGAGVAQGYWRRPELTAERFFTASDDRRFFRTGDRVRLRTDGQVEFLGRMDQQLKVRGFRIEPGEVESVLGRCAGVAGCAVGARETPGGDRRLVAWVTGSAGARLSTESLREALRGELPDYLVPSAFVLVDSLPLTGNGKLDRARLPEPEWGAVQGGYVAPRSAVEETLAGLFAEVLGTGTRVGIHDDFFSLGGHSLLATQLVSRIRDSLGVELALKRLFETPTIAGLSAQFDRAVEQQASLRNKDALAEAPQTYEFPVSFAQQRLWFLEQLESLGPVYTVRLPLRLRGALDASLLQRAVDRLVARHEALRTTIPSRQGEPVQFVAADLTVPVEIVPMDGASAADLRRRVAEISHHVFDLVRGPLLRVTLLRLASDDHVLLILAHHIVSDAWSSGILFRDLAEFYVAIRDGREPRLPDVDVQYADFASWQRAWLQGEELGRQVDFWKRTLAGAPPLLELPTDHPRPAVQRYEGSRWTHILPRAFTAQLARLAGAQGCTLFMTLLAAFQILLTRYTGQTDVVVGTPVAGRRRTELENVIGLFANTLVMRLDLAGNPAFREALARVRRVALDAWAHQELPFEKLVEALQPPRSLSYSPVFQVMFNMQNSPWEAEPIPGIAVSPAETDAVEAAKFDLTLSATEYAGEIWLAFEYSTALFEEATIARMARHYEALLRSAVTSPEAAIGDLRLQEDDELQHILRDRHGIDVPLDSSLGVHELIRDTAARNPAAVAVEASERSWTYAELESFADALASRLRRLGAGPGGIVGICLERSPEMIGCMLGVLQCGAAYLPLDPDYPDARRRFMLDDSGARCVLTSRAMANRFATSNVPMLCIEDLGAPDCAAPVAVSAGVTPGQLAYLIYTSGSTGQPKGVQVTHAGVVNFLSSMLRSPGITAADRLLAVTTISFDIAVLELMGPLCAGGTVVLASAREVRDGAALARRIDMARITVMQATPATWRVLLEAGWHGSSELKMLCGGEALDPGLAARLLACGGSLWNMYGPTETTIWSTCGEIRDPDSISVGHPIANTQVYVLDDCRRPTPLGVAGELYVGGAGVAKGYHRRAELTDERFIPDPFGSASKLYRTGDRARFLADGRLQVLGRLDEQVKLRGFRIEPGEVEGHLLRCAGVAGAVVGVREAAPGDRRLVAWVEVQAGQSVSAGQLREELSAQLPDYLLPAAFVLVEHLPRTSNGKLDRAALPRPAWGASDGARIAPRNAAEEALAELFAEVLGAGTAVGIHDDFFALGGHSLLATQLVSRVRDALGVEIPLKRLFESPTVAGLSGELSGTRMRAGGVRRRPVAGGARQVAPLSYPQQRLWFLEQLEPGNAAYHLHAAFRLRGKVDIQALQGAVDRLVARHEALRTTLESREGGPVQVIAAERAAPIERLELSKLDDAAFYRRLEAMVAAPFDLERGPLLRVALLERGAGDWQLLIVVHHIIADGWSMAVLLRELSTAYNAALEGVEAEWTALPVQYADYAHWQREWLDGGELERQLGYWRSQLEGAPALIRLPTDRPRPPVQGHRGAWHTRILPPKLTVALTTLAKRERATLFMVLVSGFALLLSRYTGEEEVVIGTPIAGRSRTELEGLIGFFVNTLVLRADLRGDPRFRELLGRLRRTALDAYANADVPFERLVDALNPPRDPSRTPLFQVMFNLHNEPRHDMRLAGLEVDPQSLASPYSKFDINLHVAQHDGALVTAFGYNADLFDIETVEWLAESYEEVLSTVATDVELRLGEVGLLGPAQRAAAAAAASRLAPDPPCVTSADTPPGVTLAQRFAGQAARRAKQAAVRWGGGEQQCWSYAALDRRARAVAGAILRSVGAGTGRVGLLLGHDGAMVAGLLGVLQAGKAYVPLDPYAPRVRHEAILGDAQLQAIVTDASRLQAAAWLRQCGLPVILADMAEFVETPGIRLPAGNPGDPAYLLFTSGTTGPPKAVVQSQENVLGQVGLWSRQLGIGETDRLSLLSGYGFDAAIQDIFGALLNGASVHPLDLRGGESAPELVDRIAAEKISIVHATPTVYRYLFGGRVTCEQDLSAVRLVVLGGEEARRADLELFKVRFRRGARLINGLGLTESTMGTQYVADHDSRVLGDRLPVGRPVPGNRVTLLDAAGEPSAWRGEIALYSPYLAAGYYRDAGLTAERFVVRENERWLLTGDLARRLPDGQLLHLGRRDRQLKIRGIRVEPGEVEAALHDLLPFGECAVVGWPTEDGEVRLVAYLAGEGPTDEAALRAALRERLPEYLVPLTFVSLDALPRRANGKLDERALPAPELSPGRPGVMPRNEIEQRLAGLWAGVLRREGIGVHDDFFALGGHSLLATRLIARIRDAFGLEVPLLALFESPTIAGLAAAVERTASRAPDPAMPALRRRPRPAVDEVQVSSAGGRHAGPRG